MILIILYLDPFMYTYYTYCTYFISLHGYMLRVTIADGRIHFNILNIVLSTYYEFYVGTGIGKFIDSLFLF